jgi:glucokinase
MDVSVGVDMGGTRIKIGLVKNGNIIAHKKINADSNVNLTARLVEIKQHVDQLLEAHNCTAQGVGLAFPDIVDSDQNKIISKYVKYPDSNKVNLEQWAMESWGVPIVVENDARAALLGEWQHGTGRGCDDLVLITLGTGVGTAVMINGQILRGKHYLAGNLGGHMTINLHGTTCNCGNIGCLESESSTWALHNKIKKYPDFANSALAGEQEIDFESVFKKAKEGDKVAALVKADCLKAWAFGILNLVHAYDPERIIMGGGIMKSQGLIIPYVKEIVKKHSWVNEGETELMAATQVEYAGILGVCYLLTTSKKERKL